MIASGQQQIGSEAMSLEVVWRNPLTGVQVHLRAKERSDPYYGWAEQARKIRARRANWDANHCWAA